jgi:hypothetical protein
LKKVWFAIRVSPLGRAFPRLVGASHDLLMHQRYGRSALHVAQSPLEVEWFSIFLSPRCQCASQQTRRRHAGNKLGEPHDQAGRKLSITLKVKSKKNGLMHETPWPVLVPEWVSHSCLNDILLDDIHSGRAPKDIGPRWFLWSTTAREPPQLQGHDDRRCTDSVYRQCADCDDLGAWHFCWHPPTV